jgi:hypothetical protein
MGKKGMHIGFLLENHKEIDQCDWITLGWTLREEGWDGVNWTDLTKER